MECVIACGWSNICSEPSLEGYMNSILLVDPSVSHPLKKLHDLVLWLSFQNLNGQVTAV
jgi:hypothetical protein